MLINAPTLRPLLAAPTQGVRVGCFTASASSSILVADSGDAVAGAIAQVLGGGLALFAGASFLLTAALALWFWNESYVLSLRKQRYKQLCIQLCRKLCRQLCRELCRQLCRQMCVQRWTPFFFRRDFQNKYKELRKFLQVSVILDSI